MTPLQSWADAGVDQFNRVVSRNASLPAVLHHFGVDSPSTELLCMAAGFAGAAATALARVHASGVTFSGAGSWLNDCEAFVVLAVNREFNASPLRRHQLLMTLGNALSTCLERGYLTPAPVVRSEAKPAPEPAPLKVEIVGIPERVTTTDVERDGNGNITKSTQVERDAAR